MSLAPKTGQSSVTGRGRGMRAGGRMLSVGAAVTALALTLTGCVFAGKPMLGPDNSDQQQTPQFEEYYAQEVSWEECDATSFDLPDRYVKRIAENPEAAAGMQCAWVSAPLDWNDPTAQAAIKLAVVNLPATGDDPIGSLMSNPGGPGGSGFTSTIGQALSPVFAEVREHYHFVGFDPRGMQRSTPVVCDSETSIRSLAIAQCDQDNILAKSMGTTQVAHDLDLLRHLSGDERLNYTGYSYGTTIGATYATLFPERVGRIMLDSAWPTDWASALGGYQQLEARAHALDDLFAQCSEVFALTDCPIANQSDLVDTMGVLAQQPLMASDGTPVDQWAFSGYLVASLYQDLDSRKHSLQVAALALRDNQGAIDEIAESLNGEGVNIEGGGSIVRCLSSPIDANLVGLDSYIREHGVPEYYGGPEISDSTISQFFDLTCDALPNKGADYLPFTNFSDETILVIGITGDHATPYQGSVQMVSELGNARLLTLEGSGHVAAFESRSTCIDSAAVNFLVRGELPKPGTVCTDD